MAPKNLQLQIKRKAEKGWISRRAEKSNLASMERDQKDPRMKKKRKRKEGNRRRVNHGNAVRMCLWGIEMQCLWTFCWFGGRKRIVNMHGRQIPRTIKYLQRMNVRSWEKSSSLSAMILSLGERPSVYTGSCYQSLQVPGAYQGSARWVMCISTWHKQLYQAFLSKVGRYSCPPPLRAHSECQGRLGFPLPSLKRGGPSFSQIQDTHHFGLLCHWLLSATVHQTQASQGKSSAFQEGREGTVRNSRLHEESSEMNLISRDVQINTSGSAAILSMLIPWPWHQNSPLSNPPDETVVSHCSNDHPGAPTRTSWGQLSHDWLTHPPNGFKLFPFVLLQLPILERTLLMVPKFVIPPSSLLCQVKFLGLAWENTSAVPSVVSLQTWISSGSFSIT